MTAYDDWLSSLPPHIQKAQRAWERRRRCRKMRAAGMSCVEIAAKEGISRGRVWQLITIAHRKDGHRSPAEYWCRLGTDGRQIDRELWNIPSNRRQQLRVFLYEIGRSCNDQTLWP